MKSHYLLHSFAAAISDTILPTIATATASSLIIILKSLCFPFVPSKISWPHFAISACPRASNLPRNSGMPPHSTVDQKSRTNDPDSIHGSSRGVSSTNSRCSFLVLASHFSHQRFWLLSTILHTWPMQLLQFWIYAQRDYPEIDFCWLFPLAFHESISCIPGIALVVSKFSIDRTVAHPL